MVQTVRIEAEAPGVHEREVEAVPLRTAELVLRELAAGGDDLVLLGRLVARDRGDFGGATSFNSLKTLHGGLRSLAPYAASSVASSHNTPASCAGAE